MIRIALIVLLAVSAVAQEYENGIDQMGQVTRGLVAYWSMRNSGTTVYDEVGGLTGTSSTGVSFSVGNAVVTSGAVFNGSGSKISIGDTGAVDFGAGDFSISAWIKTTNLTYETMVVSKWFSAQRQVTMSVGFSGEKSILIAYNTDGGAGTVQLRSASNTIDTAWTHVVGQRLGNGFVIYKNGASIAAGTTSGVHGSMYAGTADLQIGAREFTDSYARFIGSIDEVRIYNRAITSDEVGLLYRMGATPRGIK
jgi:hypothetical protein